MRNRWWIAPAVAALCAAAWPGARQSAARRNNRRPAPARPAAPAGPAGALVRALDADKDGSLTADEVTGTFGRWYASADTAKAGSITAPAARRRHQRRDAPRGRVRRPQHQPARPLPEGRGRDDGGASGLRTGQAEEGAEGPRPLDARAASSTRRSRSRRRWSRSSARRPAPGRRRRPTTPPTSTRRTSRSTTRSS